MTGRRGHGEPDPRHAEWFPNWPDGLVVVTRAGVVVDANARAAAILRSPLTRIVNHRIPGIAAPLEPGWHAGLTRRGAVETAFYVDLSPLTADGELLAGTVRASAGDPAIDGDGLALATVFDAHPVGLAFVAPNGTIDRVNPALCETTGFSEQALLGGPVAVLFHPEDAKLVAGFGRLRAGMSIECRIIHRTGVTRWARVTTRVIPDGPRRDQLLLYLKDITTVRKYESGMAAGALFDEVTQLPNALLLTDRIGQSLLRDERSPTTTAVLTLSVEVPEAEELDAVLVAIAKAIKDVVRHGDTVARGGEDELVVVLTGLATAASSRVVADRIREAALAAITVDVCTIGAGLALARTNVNAGDLVHEARLAATHARQTGGGRLVEYPAGSGARLAVDNPPPRDVVIHLAEIETPLWVRPIKALADGELLAVELVLCRPDGRLVPTHVAPADDVGLRVPFMRGLVDDACHLMAQWEGADGPNAPAIVSVAAQDLTDAGFVPRLRKALDRAALSPSRLMLASTEEALSGGNVSTLTTLSDLGVGLAVRDFGSGYGSLTHLRSLGVTLLILEPALLRGDEHHPAVLASIARLAGQLGMRCVGDQLDTPTDVGLARSLGILYGSGDAVAPTVSALDSPRWFAAGTPFHR